jgi:hypothetical protein
MVINANNNDKENDNDTAASVDVCHSGIVMCGIQCLTRGYDNCCHWRQSFFDTFVYHIHSTHLPHPYPYLTTIVCYVMV